MKTISATDAKQRFGELLEQVRDGAVTIRRNGRDVAVLMTPEELQRRIDSDRGANGVSARVAAASEDIMTRYDTVFRKLAE